MAKIAPGCSVQFGESLFRHTSRCDHNPEEGTPLRIRTASPYYGNELSMGASEPEGAEADGRVNIYPGSVRTRRFDCETVTRM